MLRYRIYQKWTNKKWIGMTISWNVLIINIIRKVETVRWNNIRHSLHQCSVVPPTFVYYWVFGHHLLGMCTNCGWRIWTQQNQFWCLYWAHMKPFKAHTPTKATSHTRLRARYQYTSSTLIGGKGGVVKFAPRYARGTNGVCGCKMDVKSTWIPT